MRFLTPIFLLSTGIALAGCNMRGAEAGSNGSEQKVGNASLVEPIDKTPLSSTPGAAPDNSTIEPRAPVTR